MPIRGSRRPNVVPITAPSFPTAPRPHVYRKIAYTFVALAVIVVVAVLWLSSVRAEVTVKVKRTSVKIDNTVDVAKNPQSGQIPGRVVQGTFEKIQEFQVKDLAGATSTVTTTAPTTTIVPPTQPVATDENVIAKGTVRIINKYSREQTLVKTTRLLTDDGKLYRIDKTIKVPSGGEVTVGVYADKSGSAYAIGPTKFTIPGLFIDLQKFIYAVSDQPFIAVPSSQVSVPTPVNPTPTRTTTATSTGRTVTQADIDAAQKILTEAVLEHAKQTLAADMAETNFTEVVYFFRQVEKTSSVVAGDQSDRLIAKVKLDVTAVYFPKEDMLSLVRAKLRERIPEGREFVPFNDQSVFYSLESSDVKTESATIRFIADAEYRLTSTSPALDKSVIAGKSKAEAITLLKAVEGVEDVIINLRPRWLNRLPTLKDHIDMKIE